MVEASATGQQPAEATGGGGASASATPTPESAVNWEERWQAGSTPWDKDAPTPALTRLITAGDPPVPKGRALVPGCGSGYDVVNLAQHGWTALGLDISPTAVTAAIARRDKAGLTADQAHITTGDFFTLETTPFDVIFDYTFLCALQPPMRTQWAQRMSKLLADHGELITLIYPIEEKEGGPPFAMSVELVRSLLEPHGFEALDLTPNDISHASREGREVVGRWRKRQV